MISKRRLNHLNGSFQKSQDRKKACQVRSNVKALLIVFFEYNGIVHHEFLLPCRTVNKEYYLHVLYNLCEAIWRKQPKLWRDNSWILHHDNALAHTALLIQQFLAKHNTAVMPQLPYSLDMAFSDFSYFPNSK